MRGWPVPLLLAATVVLAGRLASPALALVQHGQHATSQPALLADRLIVASEDILQARSIGQCLGGHPTHLQPDSPRWTHQALAAADQELHAAAFDTIDPAEQDRIAGLRSRVHALVARLDRRRRGLDPALLRLYLAVHAMASEVAGRVANRVESSEPSTRPPLGAKPAA